MRDPVRVEKSNESQPFFEKVKLKLNKMLTKSHRRSL